MHDDSKRRSQTRVTSPYQLLRTLYYHGTPSKEHTKSPTNRKLYRCPPPGPSRLTPAELALTRPNLRRFDFNTMVPPNWYLGKFNHAVDVVTPTDSNGNHYISVRLHYFDNPRTDGVGYLVKKGVGGVDGERALTVDERVKLGIGMSFADVEARGRMRG